MRTERKTAITVGVLYIAATVAGVLSMAMGGLGLPLNQLATHESQFLASEFFVLVMAITIPGIAIMFYPVLRRDADTSSKQGLALWYVATRITEGTLFLVGILLMLSLLALSQEMARAGAASVVLFRGLDTVLRTAQDYSGMLAQTVFIIGAAMVYWLLYVSKRVPRWISVWGLISVPLFFAGNFMLPFTHDPNSTIATALYMPLAIQEMVLAVWLIARGFNPVGETEAHHG